MVRSPIGMHLEYPAIYKPTDREIEWHTLKCWQYHHIILEGGRECQHVELPRYEIRPLFRHSRLSMEIERMSTTTENTKIRPQDQSGEPFCP